MKVKKELALAIENGVKDRRKITSAPNKIYLTWDGGEYVLSEIPTEEYSDSCIEYKKIGAYDPERRDGGGYKWQVARSDYAYWWCWSCGTEHERSDVDERGDRCAECRVFNIVEGL